jgi:hypothetical protein
VVIRAPALADQLARYFSTLIAEGKSPSCK